jgi:hypothetical protein
MNLEKFNTEEIMWLAEKLSPLTTTGFARLYRRLEDLVNRPSWNGPLYQRALRMRRIARYWALCRAGKIHDPAFVQRLAQAIRATERSFITRGITPRDAARRRRRTDIWRWRNGYTVTPAASK